MDYPLHQRHATFSYQQIMGCHKAILYLLVIVPLVAFLSVPLVYGITCLLGDWRYRHDTFMRERIMHSLERGPRRPI